jgi:hypothetical protein
VRQTAETHQRPSLQVLRLPVGVRVGARAAGGGFVDGPEKQFFGSEEQDTGFRSRLKRQPPLFASGGQSLA